MPFDRLRNHGSDMGGREREPLPPGPEAGQVLAWEEEGGRTARATDPVRILIVDDDRSSANALKRLLPASDNFATRIASSGRAALAVAAEFQPQVVMLALDLPDMSGYEAAQSLREGAQSRELRLIALTSSREHEDRERARTAGFERYLLTPVTALELAELFEMPARKRDPEEFGSPPH